jgi:leucyl/phenylalanyl-tRNA--protein transferase
MPVEKLFRDDPFPPLSQARHDGLLAMGGSLSPQRLSTAYRLGIFPWFSKGSPILWWSPDPRFVLFPKELKVSKSMRQCQRKGTLRVTYNTAFQEVIQQCAQIPRADQDGTWILPEMQEAYLRLFQQNQAISVEVWEGENLVGGLYGVKVGRVFSGESMFSKASNSSKLALIELVQTGAFDLIDCQIHSEHLASLGAREIPRSEFLSYLPS